jgi:ribonucleoside-diphosphate reductase alpha chain
MPGDRNCITRKVNVGGHEGYIIAGMYEDGTLGEVFLHGFGQGGSTLDGWTQVVAILFSVAVQYGAPLDRVARKIAHMKFEPYGHTDDPEIPWVPSVPSYIFAWLAVRFGPDELGAQVKEILSDLSGGRFTPPARRSRRVVPSLTQICKERGHITGRDGRFCARCGEKLIQEAS